MNALWTRISLGAVGIFVVGMAGVTAVHHARDNVNRKLQSFLDSPSHNTAVDETTPAGDALAVAPMARLAGLRNLVGGGHGTITREMDFKLDGRTVGTIRRMVIQRNTRGDIPAMNITVDLNSDAASTALSHCDLLLAVEHGDGMDSGFRCAEADAPGTIAVGWARFEPNGETRPIAVTSRGSRELRSGDPFKATIENGQVEFSADGKDGGLVRIQANDNGANIRINDGLGRAIFGLLADSTGASLRVKGKNGKDIVRMVANDGGFSLVVDTSGAH